ncbi:hypothetical protein NA78x_005435 [Anatilimnocola sp. NA78]|uniref:hypothetical protein n=1 Tax=Anatilimnocola sp. NA78 TaxID=3415683 RepID=UPI003CE45395
MSSAPSSANGPEHGQPSFEDLRRFARRDCKLSARLRVMQAWDPAFGETREFDVIVRNISRCGACFLFFRQLYPDDHLQLDYGDLRRHYRVSRCRRVTQNCYEIGIAILAKPGT